MMSRFLLYCQEWSDWIFGSLFLGSIFCLLVVLFYRAWTRRCPRCKRRARPIANRVLKEATYSHSGKGERVFRCRHCGEELVETYTIPRLGHSSGSSSGFGRSSGGYSGGGSFGGGSTSGGGAGGRW